MAGLTLLLVLAAATVLLAPLAERINLPYPVVMLMFGLAVAFVPGLSVSSLNPELILPLVLPPLLFAAARRTSWRQFLDNRRAIMLLAVALVGVTAFVVGIVLQAIIPGLPLIAAIALGAAVAPPDPVAATAVAHKLHLPRRLRTILEGEGLSNDATSLVLYEVAVASAMAGAFAPVRAGAALAAAVAIGVAAGLAIAVATRWLLGKLPAHPAGSALVLVMPFAAYIAADAAHGSGVLAVVTVALALSRYADHDSAQTRLVTVTTWEIVELLVTGAAFAFVGLELRAVAEQASDSIGRLTAQALLITAVVVVVRFAWIFPVAALDEKLLRKKRDIAEPVGWREMTVASWAGMRGVVTLAAVLALPRGFPERERLIFIAFVVIIATMLVQGLTLPLLVRALGVTTSGDRVNAEERDLLRAGRAAGFRRLDEIRRRGDISVEVLDEARENANRMWHSLGASEQSDDHGPVHAHDARTLNALKEEMLEAARDAVVDHRSESGSDPLVVDTVLRRLDARGSTDT
ncbi:Na+/H+ antiporter [Mycolicibacterium sp. BiH015]|uniref:Na+/H+ antiporter n=1 Tax=Mycolicibacterium sp. BiH015 TaxID=3018808 RepID=UPI0022E6ED95|nr:Na+/H+ antiporter [Mycolicibacterium sp. BiH015]MDA2895368.1 Na+/H+ antiporter [Mycolicibacterium sp. BiH015]